LDFLFKEFRWSLRLFHTGNLSHWTERNQGLL
jgi:hypothetical protein